jgi:hypothetical protein
MAFFSFSVSRHTQQFNLDMPKGPSLRLGLSRLQSTRRPLTSHRRFIQTSLPCSTCVTLPLYDVLTSSVFSNDTRHAAASEVDPRNLLKTRLVEQLDTLLVQNRPSPARVWGQYLELLRFIDAKNILPETHQSVLRHCVPPALQLRLSTARRMRAGHDPRRPHVYEHRLQTVIRNIKATGAQPTLEDYHVILKQFAAVGYYMGAAHVYEELATSNIRPEPKTYGLLLQSLAHRLTLACPESRRPQLVRQITRICRDILAEMWDRGIPFSSANLDLAVRILKETADEEGFAHLMKIGYGIDLDYPDRAPIGSTQHERSVATDVLGKVLPNPQPFSTAALNTTIDMLGRFGNVSKLVQTFEVLTRPLPSQADQHFSQSFDDEDDDYGVSSPASIQSYRAPHAAPNTTTYITLLRHLSRAGHGPLARHYLQQAYRFDRVSDRANRSEMINLPNEVPAPHFGVNRGTILPVFGLANRTKDMELMRWVEYIIRQTMRRKRNDIMYYSAIAARLAKEPSKPADQLPPTPSSPSQNTAQREALKSHRPVDPSAAVFAVDLDASWVPPPAKKFNIYKHLQILHHDLEELESFYKEVSNVTSRTAQRIKERLGRRVWAGKDIYLLHEDKRKLVSRQTWSAIVGFKRFNRPEHQSPGTRLRMHGRQTSPYMRPDFVPGRRLSSAALVYRTSRGRHM